MTSNQTDDPTAQRDLLLPERSVLLHIGPHKTGTTALQGSLHHGRAALAEHGVVYAGRERQHQRAALGLTNIQGLTGDAPPSKEHWERLVQQVNAATDQRVIVSSEFFTGADDQTAREVVDSFGGSRVHILVTLRPLAKILPSAWQQHVRNRLEVGYDEWLDGLFNRPPYDWPTPSFWNRHHHDRLIERWAAIVGPERVTVVLVDQLERDGLMRTVERLVGVPSGLLVPDAHVNRSLTYAETEAIRRLNIAVREQKLSAKQYKDVVRMGVIQNLQLGRRPGPDEAPIRTPRWALDRAGKIGADAAARIEASGVRVIGDLSLLGNTGHSNQAEETNPTEPQLPVDALVAATVGAIKASPTNSASPTKPADTSKDTAGNVGNAGKAGNTGTSATSTPKPQPSGPVRTPAPTLVRRVARRVRRTTGRISRAIRSRGLGQLLRRRSSPARRSTRPPSRRTRR